MSARRRLAASFALAALVALASGASPAGAEVPRAVGRAFLDQHVPLNRVAIVVQEVGKQQPLFTLDPDRPMNPASVMKLVTTYAALDLLGRDYRWKTEAYLGGPLTRGTLQGDLILKGYGDPKITVEQWQAFMDTLRRAGLDRIDGDLALDRSYFALPQHDDALFDHEPLKPYNVGPDALLVNFKSVRFVFAPDATATAVKVVAEPALADVAVGPPPPLGATDCGDWRSAVGATFVNDATRAQVSFGGRYPVDCGEREWWVALLDHPHYVHGIFTTLFRDAGGTFAGGVREGRAPRGSAPFATLESPPLYDIVRDVNKLSNNVMAQQIFLTLATTSAPPPATPAKASAAVKRWLRGHGIAIPGLVIENGSGLSRKERISARGLARLLLAADRSPVRDEFASSLAVAATDGTLVRRFQNGTVAGQALLKTGTLEGVRALAGYVIDAQGRRFAVAAIVNHASAARAAPALDHLVQWVYENGATWDASQQKPR